jgi:RimJ/RimL family protein N-acetyltransferase
MSLNYSAVSPPMLSRNAWRLPDGTRVTLRPILPQDGPLLGAMLGRLSPASRHNRFHGGVRAVTAAQLERLSTVDHDRHVAFVITASPGPGEQVIAEARYFIDTDSGGDSAEFALVVDDRWQRRGLGLRAMDVLAATARAAGLRWLYGSVMAHNHPMLALLRRCRFRCTEDRADPGMIKVETRLGAGSAATPRSRRIFGMLGRWLPWLHSF